MKKVEEILSDIKLEIDEIEVPEELEMRLNSALQNKTIKIRRKINWKIKAAAAFIAVILIGYNFNTLALYGKKFVGYDYLMDDSLKQLNELGKGQPIGKSCTLKNGIVVTLDGIISDDNELLGFYTLKDYKGRLDKIDFGPIMNIESSNHNYYAKTKSGSINKDKTEAKYIVKYEATTISDENLTAYFSLFDNKETENGKIDFIFDKNKAMGHILKKKINKSIKVDEGSIKFKSVIASPMSTVIDGSIQNIFELAIDQIRGTRFRDNNIDLRLIANGKEVQEISSGMITDMNGMNFKNEYEKLPDNLKSLKIKLVSFDADHDVDSKVELKKGEINKSINILNENIKINNLHESKGDTYINITTEKGVVLTKVYLIMDGKKVELKNTIPNESDEKIQYTRTLHFTGTGKKVEINIKRMSYSKIYNQFIDIPIN